MWSCCRDRFLPTAGKLDREGLAATLALERSWDPDRRQN
jgi:hypothetical protein